MTVQAIVLMVHAVACLFIIMLVLFQRGKGAEAGAAFGAGASGTVFGAKGSANFLSRSTGLLAAVFFATSLGLAYLGSQRPVATSIVDQVVEEVQPGGAGLSATEPADDALLSGELDADLDLGAGKLPDVPEAPEPPSGDPPEQN